MEIRGREEKKFVGREKKGVSREKWYINNGSET